MALSLLSSILLLSSPLSSPLVLVEPLTLSTGVEVEARYVEPSDEFCLSLDDFAQVKSDLEHSYEYIEKRLVIERRAWQEHIVKIQEAHDDVHRAYVLERDKLKSQRDHLKDELSDLKTELWWWRVGLVGVLSLGAFSTAYLLAP